VRGIDGQKGKGKYSFSHPQGYEAQEGSWGDGVTRSFCGRTRDRPPLTWGGPTDGKEKKRGQWGKISGQSL